jgi:hypothetical protein
MEITSDSSRCKTAESQEGDDTGALYASCITQPVYFVLKARVWRQLLILEAANANNGGSYLQLLLTMEAAANTCLATCAQGNVGHALIVKSVAETQDPV